MSRNKTPKVSYENFCKAFAGVFKKHAYRQATYHTCYVRAAIDAYADSTPERRANMMEDASREELVGYRIAAQLLRCGWTELDICAFADQQQGFVDAMEDRSNFLDVLAYAGYRNDAGFARDSNGVRYAWLLAGGRDLEDVMDEMESEDDDEDDD